LARTLYEAPLFGSPAFTEQTAPPCSKKSNAASRHVRGMFADIPADLENIILKAMARTA